MAIHFVASQQPEPYEIAVVETADVLGNCGLRLLSDVCNGRGFLHPKTPELRDAAYKALAEFLDGKYRTNFVLSDNILKLGRAYPEPRTTMDSLNISTGGFAEYLIRTKYGRITGSHRMSNPNHRSAEACSIIQLWIWTPPSLREYNDEYIINSGYVKRKWLRGRDRIFKCPEELKNLQPVSTKW